MASHETTNEADSANSAASTGNSAGRFAGLRAALQYLFRAAPPSDGEESNAARRSVKWFIPLGFLVGLAWIGVFRLAWREFGDPEMTRFRAVPALAVVLLEAMLTGSVLFRGLAAAADSPIGRAMDDERGVLRSGGMIAALILLAHWVLIAGLPERIGWYPQPGAIRYYFNRVYPLLMYRPLLLAPLWGRWGILLAASVGSPSRAADPFTRSLAAAATPGVVLRWLVAPLGLTALYTHREGMLPWGMLSSLAVLLCTYLLAVRFARRCGGQSRATVLACGAVAQCIFLAAYAAFCV